MNEQQKLRKQIDDQIHNQVYDKLADRIWCPLWEQIKPQITSWVTGSALTEIREKIHVENLLLIREQIAENL